MNEQKLTHYFSNRVVQVKRSVKSIQNLGYFTIGKNLNRNSIYFAFNGQILSINGVTRVTARKLIRVQKNNVLIDYLDIKEINYNIETIKLNDL